jgi:endonuclease III
MKNASKHADTLKSLFKKLRKEHPPAERTTHEPLKALVRGVMSYDVPDSRADEAVVVIEREYVDLNELRVATELEMQDMLGSRYPDIEKRVFLITTALNAIFEKESTLSLERLKTLSKKDARQVLRDLPGMTPFTEAYVMTFAFDGNCVPVDQNMAEYLKEHDAVDPDSTVEDVQKFLEHNLKAEECFEFYSALRQATADVEPKKKAKAKA